MRRNFLTFNCIKDLVIVKTDLYEDFRGKNIEGFNKEVYKTPPFDKLDFTVDSFSYSKRGVLRGFHGDKLNWKIIQCIYGAIQFKAIDLRTDSPTYKKVFHTYLYSHEPTQILLPPGIVNAHQCISEYCIFFYKLSHNYTPQDAQLSVKWNDPEFNLNWDISEPILSDRDK